MTSSVNPKCRAILNALFGTAVFARGRLPGNLLLGLILSGVLLPGINSVSADVIDEAAVLAAMGKPGRLAADIERDRRSKPQYVIPLLKLETGDRVVDIFAAGGYYSELLASVVGPRGEVLLHNNPGFEAWGINGLRDRFDNRNPGSITRYTSSGINLDLTPNSLDGALVVMALHDLYVVPKRYNGSEYVRTGNPANVDYFLAQVFNALKPGGRFVVVDHAAEPGTDPEVAGDLHRMSQEYAQAEVLARGFVLVDSTDALRSSTDDRTRIVFDEDIQGQTDRFVLAFEKPL